MVEIIDTLNIPSTWSKLPSLLIKSIFHLNTESTWRTKQDKTLHKHFTSPRSVCFRRTKLYKTLFASSGCCRVRGVTLNRAVWTWRLGTAPKCVGDFLTVGAGCTGTTLCSSGEYVNFSAIICDNRAYHMLPWPLKV